MFSLACLRSKWHIPRDISVVLRCEPRAAGWEAQTLPLCSVIFNLYSISSDAPLWGTWFGALDTIMEERWKIKGSLVLGRFGTHGLQIGMQTLWLLCYKYGLRLKIISQISSIWLLFEIDKTVQSCDVSKQILSRHWRLISPAFYWSVHCDKITRIVLYLCKSILS